MITAQSTGHEAVLDRIRGRRSVVGIMGLGYVGLPLAVASAEAGFPTLGFDHDPRRVSEVNHGSSPVRDVAESRLRRLVPAGARGDSPPTAGTIHAAGDLTRVSEVDVAVVCVPTPLTRTKDPDLSHVVAAAEAIAAGWHPGMAVILESTSFPGTTEEVLRPRLEAAGARHDGGRSLRAGEDFYLAFSPERIDPGRTDFSFRTTPKVVGGITPRCLQVASEFYSALVDRVVPVSTPATAEMVKILENTFRAVNVALANETAVICHALGIDVWEVIEAARTKPFGFMPFYPGPGLGGHCIPVDPLYLAWRLRGLRLPARSIELADELNSAMPSYVVGRVDELLDQRGRTLSGARVLLLGMTYKPDVCDVRESPSVEVFERLARRGAIVGYHDPLVPRLEIGGIVRERTELSPASLAAADCVVILTAHSTYDWPAIVRSSRLVFDTRNAAGHAGGPPGKVVTL